MSDKPDSPAAPSRAGGRPGPWPWLAMAAILVVHVVVLRSEGRRWWCACGSPALWTADAWGPHNSQHLLDPYSFTHVLHGILLCGLLALICPRLPAVWRLVLAVALEAGWEMFENSAFVVERYRAATAAQGYMGDTVANSVGDVLSCGLGFILARRIGWLWSAAVFLATEAILLVWIRDSLLLNVVMLIHPLDAIEAWQKGH